MSQDDQRRVPIIMGRAEKLDMLGKGGGGGDPTVTVAQLRASVDEVAPAIMVIVDNMKEKAKAKGLTEITLALGINGKGTVGFLGTGAEIGGSATITLKFSL